MLKVSLIPKQQQLLYHLQLLHLLNLLHLLQRQQLLQPLNLLQLLQLQQLQHLQLFQVKITFERRYCWFFQSVFPSEVMYVIEYNGIKQIS